jgi:hypothetical protein
MFIDQALGCVCVCNFRLSRPCCSFLLSLQQIKRIQISLNIKGKQKNLSGAHSLAHSRESTPSPGVPADMHYCTLIMREKQTNQKERHSTKPLACTHNVMIMKLKRTEELL